MQNTVSNDKPAHAGFFFVSKIPLTAKKINSLSNQNAKLNANII